MKHIATVYAILLVTTGCSMQTYRVVEYGRDGSVSEWSRDDLRTSHAVRQLEWGTLDTRVIAAARIESANRLQFARITLNGQIVVCDGEGRTTTSLVLPGARAIAVHPIRNCFSVLVHDGYSWTIRFLDGSDELTLEPCSSTEEALHPSGYWTAGRYASHVLSWSPDGAHLAVSVNASNQSHRFAPRGAVYDSSTGARSAWVPLTNAYFLDIQTLVGNLNGKDSAVSLCRLSSGQLDGIRSIDVGWRVLAADSNTGHFLVSGELCLLRRPMFNAHGWVGARLVDKNGQLVDSALDRIRVGSFLELRTEHSAP